MNDRDANEGNETMTEAYRTTELARAKEELAKARDTMNAARGKGKKFIDASEQVEFWVGKVSFLGSVRGDN